MLKKALFLLMTLEMAVMAIPMESIENYNVMMVHGAYDAGQTLNVK